MKLNCKDNLTSYTTVSMERIEKISLTNKLDFK